MYICIYIFIYIYTYILNTLCKLYHHLSIYIGAFSLYSVVVSVYFKFYCRSSCWSVQHTLRTTFKTLEHVTFTCGHTVTSFCVTIYVYAISERGIRHTLVEPERPRRKERWTETFESKPVNEEQ